MAIAAVIIAPLVLAFIGFIGQVSGPAFEQQVSELNGLMEETLSGEKTVIAYDRQDEAIDKMRRSARLP